MAERQPKPASGEDRFAWIDPGVSVWDQWGAVPPPPKLPPTTSRTSTAPAPPPAPSPGPGQAPVDTPAASATLAPTGDPQPLPEPSSDFDPPPPSGPGDSSQEALGPPTFHEFNAELDVGELDERLRPVTTWSARATSVNRSSLTFRSRRMCYVKTVLLVAVHLIDDKPAVLAGRVTACEYIGEGLYEVDIELMPKPEGEEIRAWEAHR